MSRHEAAVSTVTNPAPDRQRPYRGEMCGATLSTRPGDDEDMAVVALMAVGRTAVDADGSIRV